MDYWEINQNSVFSSASFSPMGDRYPFDWTIGYNSHNGYIPYWSLSEIGIRPVRNKMD